MASVKLVFWKGKFIFQGTLPFNGKTKVLSGVWNQDWPWDERTRNNQCTSATCYTNWKLQLCRQCCQILTQSQQKNRAFSSIPSEHSIQPRMYLLLELSLLQKDFKYVLTLTHTQSGWPPWQHIYYYEKLTMPSSKAIQLGCQWYQLWLCTRTYIHKIFSKGI